MFDADAFGSSFAVFVYFLLHLSSLLLLRCDGLPRPAPPSLEMSRIESHGCFMLLSANLTYASMRLVAVSCISWVSGGFFSRCPC